MEVVGRFLKSAGDRIHTEEPFKTREAILRNWEYTVPEDLSQQVIDFYALSLLHPKTIEESGGESSEDVAVAIEDAKKTSVDAMWRLCFEALYRACACEIFHFQAFYNEYIENKFIDSEPSWKNVFYDLKKNMQNTYVRSDLPGYEERYALLRDKEPGVFFDFCSVAFAQSEVYWHASYGGAAWKNIASAGRMLLAASSQGDRMVAVDHALDLEHNNGSIFTKWKGKKLPKEVLDWKRVAKPDEYLSAVSPGLQDAFAAATRKQEGVGSPGSQERKDNFFKDLEVRLEEDPNKTKVDKKTMALLVKHMGNRFGELLKKQPRIINKLDKNLTLEVSGKFAEELWEISLANPENNNLMLLLPKFKEQKFKENPVKVLLNYEGSYFNDAEKSMYRDILGSVENIVEVIKNLDDKESNFVADTVTRIKPGYIYKKDLLEYLSEEGLLWNFRHNEYNLIDALSNANDFSPEFKKKISNLLNHDKTGAEVFSILYRVSKVLNGFLKEVPWINSVIKILLTEKGSKFLRELPPNYVIELMKLSNDITKKVFNEFPTVLYEVSRFDSGFNNIVLQNIDVAVKGSIKVEAYWVLFNSPEITQASVKNYPGYVIDAVGSHPEYLKYLNNEQIQVLMNYNLEDFTYHMNNDSSFRAVIEKNPVLSKKFIFDEYGKVTPIGKTQPHTMSKGPQPAEVYGSCLENTIPYVKTAKDANVTRVALAYLKSPYQDIEASAGTKKTVYHGTNVLFNRFSTKNTAMGILWFSEDRKRIERGESGADSNKYLVTAEINVNKTAGWPEYEKLMLAQIKSEGYDSIKLDDDWVVFDPRRVKILKVEERQPDGTYKEIRNRMSSKMALEQYVGEHSAPDPEVSAPLHNLTFNEIYPDDVYTNPRHYFSGEDNEDMWAWSIISDCHKKPSKSVTIYRAVPYQESSEDLISKYLQEKAYIQKTGKMPRAAVKEMNVSRYYEYLNHEIELLKEHPQKSQDNIKRINPGDWVTIVRKYAVDHGRANLRNQFKVLSKTVIACDLWTDGNSLLEWGYNPGAYSRMKREKETKVPSELVNKEASSGGRIPKSLQGLAAEALKYDTFKEFEHAFLGEIKHGTYWHWTDDPNFKIDPSKGPRDMSSLSTGSMDAGKLMITSDLEYWSDYGPGGKGRPYVALIDMSEVPKGAYRQVNRGFGNEFFVSDPSKAKVEAVYPRQRALQVNRERSKALPQSSEELEGFYDRVKGKEPAEGPGRPMEASSSPARYDELAEKEKSGTITDAERQEAQRMVDGEARKAGYQMTLYRGDRPGKTRFTGREDKSVVTPGNIFLFDDPSLAKFYTSQRTNYMRDWRTMGSKEGLYALKVNLGDRVLKVDAKDNDWSKIEAPDEVGGKDKYPWGIQIDSLAEKARKKGYTAVVVKNALDQAGSGTQYVVFSPTQIKSSETFVYQDDGDVVPLEKRFVSKEDIRGDVSTKQSKIKNGSPSSLKVAHIYLMGSSSEKVYTAEGIQYVIPFRKETFSTPMLVSIPKVDALYKRSYPEMHVGVGEEQKRGARKSMEDFIKTGDPVEMPLIGLVGDKLDFTNGRHRFAVLRDQGKKTMWVCVYNESKDLADKHIKVAGDDTLKKSLQRRGVRGDDLLNALDLVEALRDKGGIVSDDGIATLFHRTTPESAAAIVKEQRMTSKEDGLFFGTKPTGQIEGYGDAVVKVELPVDKLELDDEFPNEYHVRMPTGTIGKKVPVRAYPMGSEPSPLKVAHIYLKSAIDVDAAAVTKVSLQEAKDRKMLGPVWHGTSQENMQRIQEEGFKAFDVSPREEGKSHGYPEGPYHDGIPAPVDHLGYGVYFTTSPTIAKHFAGGTARGLKTYYLDVPKLETINFGAPRTMMKWWLENGFDPDLAKKDRVAATKKLTEQLKSKWDAVWFKGKGIRRLLDGDQVCVYDTSRIYEIDPALSKTGEAGAKVKRKSDGVIGIILKRAEIEEQYRHFHGGEKEWMTVRWKKGGTQYNVFPKDVDFL
jgi:hypothetical protein